MNPFKSEARQRLLDIHPETGAARYERLESFCTIAMTQKIPLVVPPDLDQDLHDILSARDSDGRGLEAFPIQHIALRELGSTVGKTLHEVDHKLSKETVAILEANGFELRDERYQAPACIFCPIF